MADDTLNGQQLPTQLNPAVLATLFPGSQAPAPPPAAAGGLQDFASLAQQQTQQLRTSPAATEAAGARASSTSLAGEAAAEPLPKRGWTDTQGQPQQGGFLHNLGRALMAIGGATVPGRAIQEMQYGPGVARYQEKQAGYAERIKAAQAQAEGAEKQVGSEAQVAGRTIMGGARTEAAQLSAAEASKRTQMLAQKAQLNHQDALARISAMTDIAAKRNATEIEVQKMRDEMMTEITGMKDVTQEDVARILAGSAQSLLNTKIAEDPSIAGAIKRWFGVAGAEAPGGAQPVGGANPLPARTPAKSATPPARPKGVPADAKWDAKTQTWYK